MMLQGERMMFQGGRMMLQGGRMMLQGERVNQDSVIPMIMNNTGT
jgi:hypothetical protein